MEHIFWSIVNSISITVPQANQIIGGFVIVLAGWCAKGVWDTLSGKQ